MYQASPLEYITNQAPLYQSAQALAPTYSSQAHVQPITPIFYTTLHQEYHISTTQNYTSSLVQPQIKYHFDPTLFLKPTKANRFVGHAQQVQEFVEETFQLIFNKPFPQDIKVSILNDKEFNKLAPSSNTVGLALNRSHIGLLSEIFIRNDSLGRVMLTIGHELGHVLTPALDDPHKEEAKAFAFSLHWIKVMQEHNIAGLQNALITEMPAENGLHNVAFSFVQEEIKKGKTAFAIYRKLTGSLLEQALF